MRGHVRRRGAKWEVIYYDAAGRRGHATHTRKLDAEKHLAATQVDQLRGTWIDPTAGRVTFGEYARTWVAQRPIRDSTRERYVGYVRHMVELDPVPLADLSRAMVRAWQVKLSGRQAKSTARIIRGVAASIMKDAALDRLITVSPFDGVKAPPRPDRVLIEPLPLTHVFALHDAITPRYRAAITVGQGVGLRRGETFGLTIDRVDFLRKTIKVDRQLIGVRAGRPVFGPPKTAASNAVVPVAQSVLDELAAHIAEFPPGADGLIFAAPRGGPVMRVKVGTAWREAEVRVWAHTNGHALGRQQGGVERTPADVEVAWRAAHPDGHGHRFHDLRHVFASTLIAGGASIVEVQRLMRHNNAEETLRTYAHMFPAAEDKARGIIDAMLTRSASNIRATSGPE